MVVELAATRILTPFFGQSVFVWTNVIGVILAALALGNYAGGRLADALKSLTPLFPILALAGAFCLAAPRVIHCVSAFFLGENLHLEEAFSLLVRGSFAATLAVFAPPILLLGMALPFVVREAARSYGTVGRASGTIYAASTLGSITGTFLTTYVLVEALGSKGTYYYTGLFLIFLSGLAWFGFGRLGGRGVGLVLMVFSCVLAAIGCDRSFKSGEAGTVWEDESRYQYIRVVSEKKKPRTLYLCINEGLDSFHSIYVQGDVLTGGQYFDYYSLLPFFAGMKSPGDVLVIGLAAGTIARQYAAFFGDSGDLRIDGVEIDPDVVKAGYRYMGLGEADPWMTVYNNIDGRVFLAAVKKKYDVIIVDAYCRQVYIPFHLATEEFFHLLMEHLKAGGIFGINVGGFNRREPVIAALANTAASVFGSLCLARIPESRNFMLFAVKGKGAVALPPRPLDGLPSELDPLLAKIESYGVVHRCGQDSSLPVLTDDRAPLELMSDKTLMERSNALIAGLPEKE